MNKVKKIFEGYISEELTKTLGEGHVTNINVDKTANTMVVFIEYDSLVSQKDILNAEKELCQSIELSSVKINTKFPEFLFSGDYFSEIVAHMKRDNITLNGTFKDASAVLEGDTLTVELMHGGETVIKNQNAERLIASTVFDMFGKRIKVIFTGLSDLSANESALEEMQHQLEEENARAAAERKVRHQEEEKKAAS